MGDTASSALNRTETLPCPFPDDYEATGETYGRAMEALLLHMRDRHTSDVPEPYRGQVNNHLTACAHLLGDHLPV